MFQKWEKFSKKTRVVEETRTGRKSSTENTDQKVINT